MPQAALRTVLVLARVTAAHAVQRCFDARTGRSESCHSDGSWDAPTLFTGGRQDASKCMAHCREPCLELNGNTKDECGGCPSSYACRPGASGFGSTLHRPSISSSSSSSHGRGATDFYESLYRENAQHSRHRRDGWRHDGQDHDGWRHGGSRSFGRDERWHERDDKRRHRRDSRPGDSRARDESTWRRRQERQQQHMRGHDSRRVRDAHITRPLFVCRGCDPVSV